MQRFLRWSRLQIATSVIDTFPGPVITTNESKAGGALRERRMCVCVCETYSHSPCFLSERVCSLYFPSTGRAAVSHTFVEYPHYPQQQTCNSSKWTSNSNVHYPSSIWRTRSPERGFSVSSGGLQTRMPTERTISLR